MREGEDDDRRHQQQDSRRELDYSDRPKTLLCFEDTF